MATKIEPSRSRRLRAARAPAAEAGGDPRRVQAIVRRLRWALPLAIFGFVLLHQAWLAFVWTDAEPALRFLTGVFVYGGIGVYVTYRTLDWILRAAEARERMAARALEGERALAAITSSSADAIIAVDEAGVVRSWNRGAGLILGYAPEDIVGRPLHRVMPGELQPPGQVAAVRERLAEAGYVRGVQVRCRRKDGALVTVDMTRTLLRDEEGRTTGASVILRDMTSRIAAERSILALNRDLEARVEERTEQLAAVGSELRDKNLALREANAELERLDELKDEFVALASHELRAPLTNISASVELLLAREEAQAKRRKLEIIGEEAARLTRLVRGILDLSRIQAGRLHLQLAPTDPRELCEAAVARVDLGAHGLRLDLDPDAPIVWADFDRGVEVLVNLLENAVKYSEPEGGIELVARAAAGEEAVLIAVTDQGVGIPADEQARIFDRFHRVERGDDRRTYGHGLGLYIARRLVEAQGGRMELASEPGRGSTFRFTLPAAEAAE